MLAFRGKPILREDFVYELMNRAGTPRGYALIADQTPPRDDKKHWSRFLNRDTAFFVGAEKVARFLDSPVLYVAMRRVVGVSISICLAMAAALRRRRRGCGDWIMERFARQLEIAIQSPAEGCGCRSGGVSKPDQPGRKDAAGEA